MKDNFIKTVQLKTATSAIGPSALRNQGTGILKKAQKYCSEMDLSIFSSMTKNEFLRQLDEDTERMLDLFGLRYRPWGTARKALNLYLRDALYNKYLSREYNLETIEPFLEIPLDSAVAQGLKKKDTYRVLPRWLGLKSLSRKVSDQYQQFALNEAKKQNLVRIHMDMYLWLENRK